MSLSKNTLMNKAVQAATSAKILLDAGDIDGACNRAYYAMFDAARAALLAARAPVSPEIGKTHSGVLTAFSQHLIKTGIFPKELGAALKRAEETRLVADYKGDAIEMEDALEMLERANQFVTAIQTAQDQDLPP
jgi:uncharacterized protein (UPF0332 family)